MIHELTDEALLQLFRNAWSLSEQLRKLATARGLIHCPNCGEKHQGVCPEPPARRPFR